MIARYALPALAVMALAAAPALAETGHAKSSAAPASTSASAKPDSKQTAKPADGKAAAHKKHEKKS